MNDKKAIKNEELGIRNDTESTDDFYSVETSTEDDLYAKEISLEKNQSSADEKKSSPQDDDFNAEKISRPKTFHSKNFVDSETQAAEDKKKIFTARTRT